MSDDRTLYIWKLEDKIKKLEAEVKRLKDLRAYDSWKDEYVRSLEETARWNNGW